MQVDKETEIGYYIVIMEDMLLNIKTIKLREAENANGCVLAVGAFDGVHIGHRLMLSRLSNESKRLGVPAAVFTFEQSDSPKQGVKRLALWEEQLLQLSLSGVDTVYSVPFSEIRNIPAETFTTEIIYRTLGAKSVVCGYDFRFGLGRNGDASLIKALLSDKGVSVITPSAESVNGVPVSSTNIRELIASGEPEEASALLGRHFAFESEVVHGRRLGRTLGFPTLNQKYPKPLVLPRFGVYAVVCTVEGERFCGVANIGVKPTVGAEPEPLCETHLFGYSGDCYGKTVRTELVAFIRGEQRFESLSALKTQIGLDMQRARNILDCR